ncbi:MAG: ComEC family competence protein [Bacteroidaceae bacterium]|nr:ComEC family competence protein [Bacteroidaceae bacterium]
MNRILQQSPLLKVLLPFMGGIGIGWVTSNEESCSPRWMYTLATVALLLFGALVWSFYRPPRFKYRELRGVLLCVFITTIGYLLCSLQLTRIECVWPKEENCYKAFLTSVPHEKKRSVQCEAEVLENGVSSTRKVILYLPKSKASLHLQNGNILYLYARFSAPRNEGNPDEFDYRSYLVQKGISGTGYAFNWQYAGNAEGVGRSLRAQAEQWRSRLLDIYKRLNIKGDEYSVLAALTLGEKEDLSPEIKQSYASAGVSHILALSGLHVGVVYILLNAFIGLFFSLVKLPFRKRPFSEKGEYWTNVGRQLLLIAALWLFALMSGLMPPVQRACLMFSFVAMGRISGNPYSSLNLLLLSALLILAFEPLLLFDVSFELSFCAVVGILLWEPTFQNLWQPSFFQRKKTRTQRFLSKLWRYNWGIISVSITAQIATVPFIVYYFSNLPVYFLAANLAVIPLVSIIIYTAVGMLATSFLPFVSLFMANLLEREVELLNAIVQGVEHWPGATLNHLYISGIEACALALCLWGFCFFVQTKVHWFRVLVLIGILGVIGCEIEKTLHYPTRPSLTFYSSRTSPVLVICKNKEATLWTEADSYKRFCKSLARHFDREGISTERLLDFTKNSNGAIQTDSLGFLHVYRKTIYRIDNSRWSWKESSHPLSVDFLWICKGYRGKLKWLSPLFHPKEVVLDASLSKKQEDRLEKECRELKLPYTNLAKHGAYQIVL